MALEPRLILLDEPMAGMNFEEKEDMARYIVDLNEEFGMTVMMIEHDMGVVMDISHRVMVLDFGRKIAEGDPEAVLADPHVKRALSRRGGRTAGRALTTAVPAGGQRMMDYAGTRRPGRHLPQAAAASTPKSTAARWRCAKRISGCGANSRWNDYHDRVRDFTLGNDGAGPGPRRCRRHHRRQPA